MFFFSMVVQVAPHCQKAWDSPVEIGIDIDDVDTDRKTHIELVSASVRVTSVKFQVCPDP